jgi:hypothetical protein
MCIQMLILLQGLVIERGVMGHSLLKMAHGITAFAVLFIYRGDGEQVRTVSFLALRQILELHWPFQYWKT